jgi:hypothetical protein
MKWKLLGLSHASEHLAGGGLQVMKARDLVSSQGMNSSG